jgi:tetratricopeptide (TPR) repeat protein
MSNKQYEEALHQYDLAIKTSPSGPNSYVYHGNCAAAHCYLANYVNATNDCRRIIDLNPMYEKSYPRLGLSLFFQGKYEGAISAYETSFIWARQNQDWPSSRMRRRQGRERKRRQAKNGKTRAEGWNSCICIGVRGNSNNRRLAQGA